MHLDILSGRHMTHTGRETVGQFRHSTELIGRDPPEGNFDPHHLHSGLPLSINPVLQAERPEEIRRNIAGKQPQGLSLERIDFFGNRRRDRMGFD
jgi:hypothetical protein